MFRVAALKKMAPVGSERGPSTLPDKDAAITLHQCGQRGGGGVCSRPGLRVRQKKAPVCAGAEGSQAKDAGAPTCTRRGNAAARRFVPGLGTAGGAEKRPRVLVPGPSCLLVSLDAGVGGCRDAAHPGWERGGCGVRSGGWRLAV
jgi:hypothetical protein